MRFQADWLWMECDGWKLIDFIALSGCFSCNSAWSKLMACSQKKTSGNFPRATTVRGSYARKIAGEWRVSHTVMILNCHSHSSSWHSDQSVKSNLMKCKGGKNHLCGSGGIHSLESKWLVPTLQSIEGTYWTCCIIYCSLQYVVDLGNFCI